MKLAVTFPGIGYHKDKPLLYYARDLAAASGYELLDITYGELPTQVKGSEEKKHEAFRLAMAQAHEALRSAKLERCEDIIFISKSLGTIVAAACTAKSGLSAGRIGNILYTPLKETFDFAIEDGIAFHGTSDSWVETETVKEACERLGIPLYLTKGAGHSLETEDVLDNISALRIIMEQTKSYIEMRSKGL